jgi:hypothetical protein
MLLTSLISSLSLGLVNSRNIFAAVEQSVPAFVAGQKSSRLLCAAPNRLTPTEAPNAAMPATKRSPLALISLVPVALAPCGQ